MEPSSGPGPLLLSTTFWVPETDPRTDVSVRSESKRQSGGLIFSSTLPCSWRVPVPKRKTPETPRCQIGSTSSPVPMDSYPTSGPFSGAPVPQVRVRDTSRPGRILVGHLWVGSRLESGLLGCPGLLWMLLNPSTVRADEGRTYLLSSPAI